MTKIYQFNFGYIIWHKIAEYPSNKVSYFQIAFFSWKLSFIYAYFEYKSIFVQYKGPDINKTKFSSETDLVIFTLSQSGLETAKFEPIFTNWPKIGPGSSQVAPSNSNWLNKSYHSFYLENFQNIYGSWKLFNWNFDQNHLIKIPFFFLNISEKLVY